MKFRVVFILLSALLLTSQQAFSQKQRGQSPWSLSLSGGISVPMEGFKKASSSGWWTEQNGFPFLIGFSKRDNGSAEQGQLWKLELNFRYNERYSFGLMGSYQRHTLNQEFMERVMVDVNLGNPVLVDHDPYNVYTLIPYLAYSLPNIKPKLSFKAGYGYGHMGYPWYWFTDPLTNVGFGHRQKYDDISSGVLLLGFEASIPVFILRLTGSIDYLSANFNYQNITNNTMPGALRNFADVVNFRTLNLSVGLAYDF